MLTPTKKPSKHREIYRKVRNDIEIGAYRLGDCLPTEEEFVQQFGVSRPTVARALRDLQIEGIVERKVGSGTYVRRAGGGLSTTRQLGLIVPSFQMTGIFEPISAELATLTRANSYSLQLGGATGPLLNQEMIRNYAIDLCERFVQEQVAGVFFAPFELAEHTEEDSHEILNRFSRAGIPVVLLDRDFVSFPRRSPYDLVCIDNVAGGFTLADHLIGLGCRRLLFLARENSAESVRARLIGVREAMAFHGIEPRADWVQIGDVETPEFIERLPIFQQSDAVVCANDITAAHVLRFLEKNHLRVPRDIRVTGFDNAKFASFLGVSLTTMDQPCQDIAATAFQAMMDRINRPDMPNRTLLLAPKLVVRESSGVHLATPPPRQTSDAGVPAKA